MGKAMREGVGVGVGDEIGRGLALALSFVRSPGQRRRRSAGSLTCAGSAGAGSSGARACAYPTLPYPTLPYPTPKERGQRFDPLPPVKLPFRLARHALGHYDCVKAERLAGVNGGFRFKAKAC